MGSPAQLVSILVQRSLLQIASRKRARATPMLQADTLMSGNSAILASTPPRRGRKSALRISFAISRSYCSTAVPRANAKSKDFARQPRCRALLRLRGRATRVTNFAFGRLGAPHAGHPNGKGVLQASQDLALSRF